MFTLYLKKSWNLFSGNEIDLQGFLNGRSFQQMFQSIVTLNYYQNISSRILFLDALKTKKLFIKNLKDIVNLKNIVVKDRVQSNIYRKKING